MNSDLAKQIKDLAFELSVPRPKPGRVELRTQSRAEKIRLELIKLYNAEPRPESKRLVTRHNGLSISKIRRWKSQTVKAGILESMIGFLIPAVWGKSSFSDTERETVIEAAVQALPELCEKLQVVATDLEGIQPPKAYSKTWYETAGLLQHTGMSRSTWQRHRTELGDEILSHPKSGARKVKFTAYAADVLNLNAGKIEYETLKKPEESRQ